MIRHAQDSQARRAAVAGLVGPLLPHLVAGYQGAKDPAVKAAAKALLLEVCGSAGLVPPPADCTAEQLAAWLAPHVEGVEHPGVPFVIKRGKVRKVQAETLGGRLGRWWARVRS
jgi:hypothetical protein